MFKTLSAKRRGWHSGAEPGEVSAPPPVTLRGRAHAMRREPTEQEDMLWQYLKAARLDGLKFRHQVEFEPYHIADFVCHNAKLIVEVDGSQHAGDVEYDERRSAYFGRLGYRVFRFWNNEVRHDVAAVIEAIRTTAHTPLPTATQSPSPLRREGRR
jgi:very-short-patch-repair endonuclease